MQSKGVTGNPASRTTSSTSSSVRHIPRTFLSGLRKWDDSSKTPDERTKRWPSTSYSSSSLTCTIALPKQPFSNLSKMLSTRPSSPHVTSLPTWAIFLRCSLGISEVAQTTFVSLKRLSPSRTFAKLAPTIVASTTPISKRLPERS